MYNLNLNWTPYDDWALEEMRDMQIEKEMQNYRERAVGKFQSMIPHPKFAVKVALSVVVGYRESIKESEEIIEDLDLDDMEICAIEGNFELFKDLYLKQREEDAVDYYMSEVI